MGDRVKVTGKCVNCGKKLFVDVKCGRNVGELIGVRAHVLCVCGSGNAVKY